MKFDLVQCVCFQNVELVKKKERERFLAENENAICEKKVSEARTQCHKTFPAVIYPFER